MVCKESCPLDEFPAQIIGVGGVVYRYTEQGYLQLLLIKKYEGLWTLPKGRVKPNEDFLAATYREVVEETGIVGAVEQPVTQSVYSVTKGSITYSKSVTYYLVRAVGGRLRPNQAEGIVKAKWLSPDAALGRIGRERVRGVAGRAVELLSDIETPC